MCKVSDKLKLCTCSSDIETLKNYWIFHRFDKTKNSNLAGEIMMPYSIDFKSDKFNRKLLPRLLNDGNVFDIDIYPKNEDRLQLTFLSDESKFVAGFTYGFEYKKRKWSLIEYDTFDWKYHYSAERYGEISNAIQEIK